MTLGRAELAANEERDGSRRLIAAIPAAEGDAAIAADVYSAAIALAQWALEAREYDTAENAWATAERLADTTADPTFTRARALIPPTPKRWRGKARCWRASRRSTKPHR